MCARAGVGSRRIVLRWGARVHTTGMHTTVVVVWGNAFTHTTVVVVVVEEFPYVSGAGACVVCQLWTNPLQDMVPVEIRSSNVRYRPTSDSGHSYISMGIIIII